MAEKQNITLRDWYADYYSANSEYLRQQIEDEVEVDWTKPNLLIGSICLSSIQRVMYCIAANEHEVSKVFLTRANRVVRQADRRFSEVIDLDYVGLSRVDISTSWKAGLVFSPELFVGSPTWPFDVFTRFIGDEGRFLEERNAGIFIWALCALLDNNPRQYSLAGSVEMPIHPDFVAEREMAEQLGDLASTRSGGDWTAFEEILSRWLDPTFETDSYATNFSDSLSFLLSIFWAKYRLESLHYDSLVATLLGETLSAPIVISE